jgi:ribosomal protein S20
VVLISPDGNHWFDQLDAEGVREQHVLLQQQRSVEQLIAAVTSKAVDQRRHAINQALKSICRMITRETLTWHRSAGEALAELHKQTGVIVDTLRDIFPPTATQAWLIADTNALYHAPVLEEWVFDDLSPITVCLTPSVLSELDQHKVHHANQAVREKARALIARIKEYRRRGSLTQGVDVVKGRVRLVSSSQFGHRG